MSVLGWAALGAPLEAADLSLPQEERRGLPGQSAGPSPDCLRRLD